MIGSELPKGWKEVKLSDLAEIQSGGTPSRSNTAYWNGNIPWVKISDIKGKYVTETEEFITEEGLMNSSAKMFERGTILFSIFATIGKVAILDIDATTNQALVGLKNNELVDKSFLVYALIELSERISNLGKGVAQKNINISILKDVRIPLPTFTEQKQIAEKLDKLFDQIEIIKEASNKIPELLKNFRQQVLTYAVTGKLTDSDYESWELKTLDEIAIPKAGYAFKATDFIDNGIQVIRMGNLYDNKLSLDRNPVFVPENYDTDIIERSRVKRNDILLTLTGTKYKRDYGYAIKIDTDEVLLLNQRILSLTPLIDPDYLLLVLRSDEFRNQFFEFETGGVNQGNVGVKNVMTIKLHIPSPRIQEEIVRRTKILFNILDNVERRYNILCEKLDKLPQALLGKAFNGELAL